MMSLDTVVHSRTIYNVFDWLGDIGGLMGILVSIGGFIMSLHTFSFGSKLDKLLIRNLFKHDIPNIDDDADSKSVPPDEKMIEGLARRKPVEINYGWTWLCRRKSAEQRLLEKA